MTARPQPARPRIDILFGLGYDPDVRVRKIAMTLATAGHDIRILAWDRAGALPRHDRDGRIAIERIQIRSRRGRGLTQLPFFAAVGARMIRRVRARRPEVLHAVDLPMLIVALVARLTMPRTRIAIVYDAFEIYAVMVAHRFPKPVIAAIGAIERLLPRGATLVVTPGEARRRYFAERGIRSISVPNWVDPPASQPDRAASRRSLDIPEDAFAIAYAGAILASRDLESLIEHARRRPDDLVLIAGSGDREVWLREAAAGLPNVRVLGWLPDPAVLLAAIDVAYYALLPAHPYARLAAPNNLYVAIANAIPLVYREQGDLEEVGRAHVIGAPFHDAPSLDAAFDELRDPDRRREIVRGLEALGESYRWATAVAPLVSAYPIATAASMSPRANGA